MTATFVSYCGVYTLFIQHFKLTILIYFFFIWAMIIAHIGLLIRIHRQKKFNQLWISVFTTGLILVFLTGLYQFEKEAFYEKNMPDLLYRTFKYV